MRGKLLNFEEVCKLETGTKVYYYDDEKQNGIISKVSLPICGVKDEISLYLVSERFECLIDSRKTYNKFKCRVYECIEDKVKQYNLVEATEEMNKSKCHFTDAKTQKIEYAIISNKLKYIYNNSWKEVKDYTSSFVLMKFVKLPDKSVDFNTAIQSGKDIKVEHDYLDEYMTVSVMGRLKALQEGKYISVSALFATLGYICDEDVRKIINEGKWFIKED